jgi:hypothetical protein
MVFVPSGGYKRVQAVLEAVVRPSEEDRESKHPRTPFERSRWATDASRAWI